MSDNVSETGKEVTVSKDVQPKEVVAQVSGAAVGALIGLAVGGPPGAVLGAGLGPGAAALLQLAEHAATKRFRRTSVTLQAAAAIAGVSPEELASSAMTDESRFEAAMAALSAAAVTPLSEKADAFAAALAAAATGEPADIDSVQLVVKALSQLDEIHLRTLHAVADAGPNGVTPGDLGDKIGCQPEALRGVVRMLELHGLITDKSRLNPQSGVRWEVTELGRFCLNLLSSRAITRSTA